MTNEISQNISISKIQKTISLFTPSTMSKTESYNKISWQNCKLFPGSRLSQKTEEEQREDILISHSKSGNCRISIEIHQRVMMDQAVENYRNLLSMTLRHS